MIEVLLDLASLQAGGAAVLECFRRVLEQWGSRIKLAVIDHVTSTPTMHLPVAQIAALCRASGVKGASPRLAPSPTSSRHTACSAWNHNQASAYSLDDNDSVHSTWMISLQSLDCAVCVDGAHAVGAVPLNIGALDVQFYTSNLHKWACCPKSAAFLWVAASEQPSMVPLVTSHGYKRVRDLTPCTRLTRTATLTVTHPFFLLPQLLQDWQNPVKFQSCTIAGQLLVGIVSVSICGVFLRRTPCCPACSLLCKSAQQIQM